MDLKKRVKISFILPTLGNSGGISVVYKYANLLRKKGYDVVIYKSILSPNMYRYNSQILCYLHKIYCTLKSLFCYFKFKNETGTIFVPFIHDKTIRNSDFVIATAWTTAYQVEKLNKKKGKKFYFVQDLEVWDNFEKGINSYRLNLNKIVISSWINDEIKKYTGLSNLPIVFNGIDSSIYFNDKKEYNSSKGIRCLMLNHTLKKKGVFEGIQAFENAKKEFPNMELYMFGFCDKKNLPAYIHYYQNPSLEELRNLYCQSDIFIFPSLEEGWGLTPLEAMACKCAVVGTNTGFTLDLGNNEQNMMISEPGDIKKMTSNILKLCNNQELLKKISENGFETSKKLSWENSSNIFERILLNE